MSIRLDLPEALNLLNRAVAEKGEEFVYSKPLGTTGKCYYFDPVTGGPSCLVGHVLAYKGVKKEDLDRHGANIANIRTLVQNGFLEADARTQQLLAEAQHQQDRFTPWGKALDWAMKAIGKR